jgi:hypothetical protein
MHSIGWLHSCPLLVPVAAGPRCFTMRSGSRRVALDTMLDLSDIVLMTMVRPPACAGLLTLARSAACMHAGWGGRAGAPLALLREAGMAWRGQRQADLLPAALLPGEGGGC